jgi:hypothetical protein
MGTHMKTTVELSAPLLKEAKAVAAREGTTLRALLEEGLRESVARRKKARRFRLRDGSFKGKGLQPGVDLSNWEQIRSLIYEGRGG